MAILTGIDRVLDNLQEEIDKLKERAKEVNPKVEKLDDLVRYDDNIKIPDIPKFLDTNGNILREYLNYDTTQEVTSNILRKLDHLRQLYTTRHNQNIPKINNNKILFENVKKYMSLIGIPEEGYYDVTVRGKTKNIKRSNGYIQDLHKYVPFGDGYEKLMDRLKSYENTINKNFQDYSYVYHSKKEQELLKEAEDSLNQYISYLSIKYKTKATFSSVVNILFSIYPYVDSAPSDDPVKQEAIDDYNELMNRRDAYKSLEEY